MKIVEFNSFGIVFDNGNRIEDYHESDCCEEVYADFEQLDDLALAHDYNEELIFESNPHGFLFGDKRRMFFVPCYNIQNGYYNGNLSIFYNDTEVLSFTPAMEYKD